MTALNPGHFSDLLGAEARETLRQAAQTQWPLLCLHSWWAFLGGTPPPETPLETARVACLSSVVGVLELHGRRAGVGCVRAPLMYSPP
jgi:hypothetical protein